MRLRVLKSRIELEMVRLESNGQPVTAMQLIYLTNSAASASFTIVDALQEFLKAKEKTIGKTNGIDQATYYSLKNRVANVTRFLQQTKQLHIQAKDTDQRLCDKLLQWLMFEKSCTSREFCGKHIIVLKSALKQAVLDNNLEKNPIAFVSPPKDPIKPVISLETTELKRLETCILTPSLSRVRDLFLFQVYTGLSFSDAQKVSAADIYEKNGLRWIRVNREKTGTLSIVPIFPEAEAILRRYQGIVPQISNQKFNLYLKALAMVAGIDKNITSHVARKTFACISLERGVSMESVSAMLGHSSMRTTQRHYGRVTEGRLSKELRVG